jgi:hypothetical protein
MAGGHSASETTIPNRAARTLNAARGRLREHAMEPGITTQETRQRLYGERHALGVALSDSHYPPKRAPRGARLPLLKPAVCATPFVRPSVTARGCL